MEFGPKYIAKGEKSTDARLPIILTPCCGTWRRFSFDSWGPDGYRCIACSHARSTGPALPTTCAVCGCESPATSAQSSSGARKVEKNKQMVTSLMPPTGVLEEMDGACQTPWARSLITSAVVPFGMPSTNAGQLPPLRWLPTRTDIIDARKRKSKHHSAKMIDDGKRETDKPKKTHKKRHHDEQDDDDTGELNEDENEGAEDDSVLGGGDDAADAHKKHKHRKHKHRKHKHRDHSETRDGSDEEENEGDATGDKPADAPLAGSKRPAAGSILVRSKKKRKAYGRLYQNVPGLDGALAPVAEDAQNVICVIDDDVTMMVIPVAVCKRCFFESLRMSRSGPTILSELRSRVEKSILERVPFGMPRVSRYKTRVVKHRTGKRKTTT